MARGVEPVGERERAHVMPVPEEDLYDTEGDYEELQQEYEELVEEYKELMSELEDAYEEYEELENQLEALVEHYAEAVAKGAYNLAKMYADCISDILNMIAAILAIIAGLEAAAAVLFGTIGAVAALIGAEPVAAVGIGAGGVVGVGAGLTGAASGVFWLGSGLFHELSEDPPQLAYKKLVKRPLPQRLHLPFANKAKGSRPLIGVIHRQHSLNLQCPAMLDAMERYQGAMKDGEITYARRHGKMLARLAKSAKSSTREMKKSILAYAKEIEGTPQNYKIIHKDVEKIMRAIKKEGLPKPWLAGLRSVGMSAKQISEYTKWLLKFDYSTLKEAKISWHLRRCHFRLNSAEAKLKGL